MQRSQKNLILFTALSGLLLFCSSFVFAVAKEFECKLIDNLAQELDIPIYSWSKTTSPKALIVGIHGATLHGRSFTSLAEKLADQGYLFVSTDMRGFGHWYHANSQDKFAKHVVYSKSENDLFKLISKVKELYPNKPLFLLGESVGSNMAIRMLADDPKCADGIILSSPAVKQRMFLGPSVLGQLFTVFFIKPKAQLDISPYLRTRVSESPEITEERLYDPLGRNKLNAGELFKTRFFNKDCMKRLAELPSGLSVLVLEGKEDKLFEASDVEKMLAQMPCEDKTLHLFKGKGHIHLETKYLSQEVLDKLSLWLDQRSERIISQKYESNKKVSSKSSSSESNDGNKLE